MRISQNSFRNYPENDFKEKLQKSFAVTLPNLWFNYYKKLKTSICHNNICDIVITIIAARGIFISYIYLSRASRRRYFDQRTTFESRTRFYLRMLVSAGEFECKCYVSTNENLPSVLYRFISHVSSLVF